MASTTPYGDYLRSSHWQRQRKKAFAYWGDKCFVCGYRKGLQVHHLTYERLGHERMEDLRVLCERHHEWEHLRPEWRKGSTERRQHKMIQPLRRHFKHENRLTKPEMPWERRIRKSMERFEEEVAVAWDHWD